LDLLYTITSALPLGIGLLLSFHYFTKKNRTLYYRNLFAGMLSGGLPLLVLYEPLFGDDFDLTGSSTTALIFGVAPVYGVVGYIVGYALTVLVTDKDEASKPILLGDQLIILIPVVTFVVLTVGIILRF